MTALSQIRLGADIGGTFTDIVLDVGWRNHPFLRSRFLLRSDEQIDELRALGMAEVRWSPADSTTQPLDPAPAEATPAGQSLPISVAWAAGAGSTSVSRASSGSHRS